MVLILQYKPLQYLPHNYLHTGASDRQKRRHSRKTAHAPAVLAAVAAPERQEQQERKPVRPRHPHFAEAQNGLLDEFEQAKNPNVDPQKVTLASRQLVNWTCRRCPCGHPHEWTTSLRDRVTGNGCPVCAGRCLCRCSSLAAMRPALSEQWDRVKNEIMPTDVRPRSGYKAWWLCTEHAPPHSWQAPCHDRSGNAQRPGTGCPMCAAARQHSPKRKQPTVADGRPDLAAQWHPTLNGDQTPDITTLGSMRLISWLCDASTCQHPHVWQQRVAKRTYQKQGCPFCTGHRVCPCNSFQAKAPDLAAQWDPQANEGSPQDYPAGSMHRGHWQHEAADGTVHRWVATLNSRFYRQSGCPLCLGRRSRP